MAAYTLILGTKNWSSWSLRPYLAMRHIGVPFAEEVIRLRHENSTEEVRKRTPAGRVPVLKIEEDGRSYAVWDSLAICETLAERHPEANLWPDDARARAEARSVSSEMHSSFADLRDQLSMEFTRKLPAPALRETTKADIARILALWTGLLERHEGGYLFGRFSIADCMYAPVVSRFLSYGIDLPLPAKSYCERMMALPAMQDWGRAAKLEVEEGWCG